MLASRRRFLKLLATAAVTAELPAALPPSRRPRFRVRTITAGSSVTSAADFEAFAPTLGFLRSARERLVGAGYEVQTVRIATQPLAEYLPGWRTDEGLETLRAVDDLVSDAGVLLSLGPVAPGGGEGEELPARVAALLAATRSLSLSLALSAGGPGPAAARAAARTILEIARATAGGEGNFRFAAAARIPAGTPFFPVAYHRGPPAFSLGLESPALLTDALGAPSAPLPPRPQIVGALESALGPLAALCRELGRETGRRFLGLDVSPAPGLDASIAEVVERISEQPFGEPSTLAACALLTDLLAALRVKKCGYSGLMLPVLEDRVLATRAAEGRFGVSELLLYASVCGTGLDVVPLAGDVEEEALGGLIADVEALSAKLGKPLSARLFPLPGRRAGDAVSFDNPHLTDAVVMALGTSV